MFAQLTVPVMSPTSPCTISRSSRGSSSDAEDLPELLDLCSVASRGRDLSFSLVFSDGMPDETTPADATVTSSPAHLRVNPTVASGPAQSSGISEGVRWPLQNQQWRENWVGAQPMPMCIETPIGAGEPTEEDVSSLEVSVEELRAARSERFARLGGNGFRVTG